MLENQRLNQVMSEYHIPVLLEKSIEGLKIERTEKQIFIDLTFGGGGHSRRILELLGDESRLIAFDKDADAISNHIPDSKFELIKSDFRYFGKFLKYFGIKKVDGILADLGVSSYQFDNDSRGFSYKNDQMLDMRMNKDQKLNASSILNDYSESELVNIFSMYGEIRNSKQLANRIYKSRMKTRFETSLDLIDSIGDVIIGNRIKYLSQLFQALRIEVNDEMTSLKEMLEACSEFLKIDGRLSVISYHSLEDRLVKNLIKIGNVEGEIKEDLFGNKEKKFVEVVKGVILPDTKEIKTNSRARSAKLRIAKRIE